ncbi:MAG: heavy-metal-associated domain-containing protein [Bacteroidota bacterium]
MNSIDLSTPSILIKLNYNFMRKLVLILTFTITSLTFAQNKNAKASLRVDGICMMCKERIEKAAIKTKGVKFAQWNLKTHKLNLIYDERKTILDTIKSNILAVGHDVAELKASDEAYNAVHPCCKYRDEALNETHKN